MGQREELGQRAGGGTRQCVWNQGLSEAKAQPLSLQFFLQKKEQSVPATLAAQSQTQLPRGVVSTIITRGVQVARTLLSLRSRLQMSGRGLWSICLVCVCSGMWGVQRLSLSMHGHEVSAQSWGTIVLGSLLGLQWSQGLGTKWVH